MRGKVRSNFGSSVRIGRIARAMEVLGQRRRGSVRKGTQLDKGWQGQGMEFWMGPAGRPQTEGRRAALSLEGDPAEAPGSGRVRVVKLMMARMGGLPVGSVEGLFATQ